MRFMTNEHSKRLEPHNHTHTMFQAVTPLETGVNTWNQATAVVNNIMSSSQVATSQQPRRLARPADDKYSDDDDWWLYEVAKQVIATPHAIMTLTLNGRVHVTAVPGVSRDMKE
eukprot:jgi/Chrzof1/4133/Cz14g00110.t1